MDQHQTVEQAVVTTRGRIDPKQARTRLALFDENGDPIDLGAQPDPVPSAATVPVYANGANLVVGQLVVLPDGALARTTTAHVAGATPDPTNFSVVARGSSKKAMKRARHALALSNVTQMTIVGNGDSRTESSGTTKIDNGWFQVIRRFLQKSYTKLGKGGFGFLNTYAKTNPDLNGSSSGDNYWTKSGGGSGQAGVSLTNTFLGWRSYAFAANETGTLHFVGTTAKIHFRRGAGVPAFSYTVDGGAVVNVAAGSGAVDKQGVATIGPLASGPHDVVITPAAGTSLPIMGASIYDGDETTGIRFLNNAQFGINTKAHAEGIGTQSYINDIVALFPNPALILFDLMTNDPGVNTPAVVAAKLAEEIANWKAKCTITPSFLIIIPPEKGSGLAAGQWLTYVNAAKGVAYADPDNVAFISLPDDYIDPPTSANAYLRGLFNSDTIHPTDAGNAFEAQLVADFAVAPLRAAL